MKMEELRQLPLDELKIRYADTREEMQNLRIQHSTHQLDNPMLLRAKRKDIARIKTIMREKTAEAKNE